MLEIKTIAVAGAGTMGAGIAQLCSAAAYSTILYDLSHESLKKAEKSIEKNLDGGIKRGKLSEEDKKHILSRISYTTSLDSLKVDLAIEAIIEKLEPKIELFSSLEKLNPDGCIFATNTSSIPVTRIAAGLSKPERVVGMHFFNPAHIMKLVEIISGASTDPEIAKRMFDLAKEMGKVPVHVKDSPGFIVNRVARHFYVESLKVLEEGVADVKTIDELVQASGFRMGPFKLMDLIGVDTNFSVTSSMFDSFDQDPKFRPSRIQRQKVEAGHNGRKSGKGFYDY